MDILNTKKMIVRGGGIGVGGAELGAGLRKIDSVLERTRLVTYALFYYSFVILSDVNEP